MFCIIGLGYIGFPTALMFAKEGIEVVGVDKKEQICTMLNSGIPTFEEFPLKDYLADILEKGLFHCTTTIEASEVYIVAVPTPIDEQKHTDLSNVIDAVSQISTVIKRGDTVIIESTVSPRCTQTVVRPILEKTGLIAGEDFYLAYCPERVMLGNMVNELINNDRIIGGINHESALKAAEVYKVFVKGRLHLTNSLTAEITKLSENIYRDVNIALANELALICEDLGANAWEVISLANRHPRVNLHQPGPGVGGHCVAVDPWYLIEHAKEKTQLIGQARRINESMPRHVFQMVQDLLPKGEKVSVLGIAFKANVDDMRESPIIPLVEMLKTQYEVEVVDPWVDGYKHDVYAAAEGASLLILAVDHNVFHSLDYSIMKKLMKKPGILDTRNTLPKAQLEELGFSVRVLGYNPIAE